MSPTAAVKQNGVWPSSSGAARRRLVDDCSWPIFFFYEKKNIFNLNLNLYNNTVSTVQYSTFRIM
jgi:hypothetical protein